jgi:hypothetical protein
LLPRRRCFRASLISSTTPHVKENSDTLPHFTSPKAFCSRVYTAFPPHKHRTLRERPEKLPNLVVGVGVVRLVLFCHAYGAKHGESGLRTPNPPAN